MGFFGGGASVDLASPPAIGNTTPNTGAFTTLSATPPANTTAFTSSGYSLTGANAQSLFDLSGTWNTSGTPTAFKLNVTDTASNASSLLMDLQVGGTSTVRITKAGLFLSVLAGSRSAPTIQVRNSNSGIYSPSPGWLGIACQGTSPVQWDNNKMLLTNGCSFGWTNQPNDPAASGSLDLSLFRDAADILAQGRSTNAQTFRIYNTYTDASNYERGFMRWATNVLEIGAEAAGTGTQRQLRFPLGTVTASTPLSITQTWNSAGVTFTGLQFNATDTASASGSLLMDLQVGGVSKFQVRKDGRVTITEGFYCSSNSTLDGIITRQAAIYGGSDANGTLILQNSNFNNFNMLKIGGTSTSFPALKRSSATLQVRLADDSGYTVLDAQLRAQGTAPATAGATGTAGDIRYDADYIYICTAANTWKRVAIATWP